MIYDIYIYSSNSNPFTSEVGGKIHSKKPSSHLRLPQRAPVVALLASLPRSPPDHHLHLDPSAARCEKRSGKTWRKYGENWLEPKLHTVSCDILWSKLNFSSQRKWVESQYNTTTKFRVDSVLMAGLQFVSHRGPNPSPFLCADATASSGMKAFNRAGSMKNSRGRETQFVAPWGPAVAQDQYCRWFSRRMDWPQCSSFKSEPVLSLLSARKQQAHPKLPALSCGRYIVNCYL